MSQRVRVDKNKSQIVFDITGGEPYKTMARATSEKPAPLVRTRNAGFSLRTDDIEGAQYRPSPYKTRHTALDVSDIEGTRPGTAYDARRPPTDVLRIDDIEGSRPKVYREHHHSNRHTNPLNPEYQLSVKKEPPPPEIPFIYDGFNFDDVPGVHPRSYSPTKPARDIMNVSDISGVYSKRKFAYDGPDRIMDVSDINRRDVGRIRREFPVNPLNPEYHANGEVMKADYGMSHSNYLSRRRGQIDGCLTTKDIDGAIAGSSREKYRTFRSPVISSDETADFHSATSLITESMVKQTAELERRRRIDEYRGQRIRRCEQRHLEHKGAHIDPAQAAIRVQRAASVNRSRLRERPVPITL
jgi:hypothetical protein